MATVTAQLVEIQRIRALAGRARDAASRRRWREAQQTARAWLAAEPGNGEAIRIEREANEALAGSRQNPLAKLAGFAIVGLVCLGITVMAAVANGIRAPGYTQNGDAIAQTATSIQPTETPPLAAVAPAAPPTAKMVPEPIPTTSGRTLIAETATPVMSTPTSTPTSTRSPTASPTTPPAAIPTTFPIRSATSASANTVSKNVNELDPDVFRLPGTTGRVRYSDGQGVSGRKVVLRSYSSVPVYGAETATKPDGTYSLSYSDNSAACGKVQGKRDNGGTELPTCYSLAVCVERDGCSPIPNPYAAATIPDIVVDREFPILSPANGSRVGNATTLVWQAYPGASSYSVVCNKIPGTPEEVYRGTATSASIASFSAASGSSFGCNVHALDAAQNRIAVASVTLIRE